ARRGGAAGTLAETGARIGGGGGRGVWMAGDAPAGASLGRAVDGCGELLGSVEILVNTAAQGPYRRFEELSERDFRRTFDANVRAPLELARLVAPEMRARRQGWIVNISSATAILPQGPPFP